MIAIKGDFYTEQEYQQQIDSFFACNNMIYCEGFKCRMTADKCKQVKEEKIQKARDLEKHIPGITKSVPCLTCEHNHDKANYQEIEKEPVYKICKIATEYPEKCPSNKDGVPGKFLFNSGFTKSTWDNTKYCCDSCRAQHNTIIKIRDSFKKNNTTIEDVFSERLFGEAELADFLGVFKGTIARWRKSEYLKIHDSTAGKRDFVYKGQDIIDLMKFLQLE